MNKKETQPVTIYTPDSSLASPGNMLRDMLRDLSASRELAWRLAVRDISAQYRQAFLGILWAFILPLANTVTWIFLSKTGIVSVGETALPYPVYVFSGSMLWAILMDAVNAPLQQTSAAKAMLAKFNFPRESLVLRQIQKLGFNRPLRITCRYESKLAALKLSHDNALVISGIYQTLFNASIKITLLLVVLPFIMGVDLGWCLLLFPVGLISLVLVGTAIGLLLTPVY